MHRTFLTAIALSLIATLSLPSWSFGRRGGGSDDSQESGHHHAHWQAPAAEANRANPVAFDKASIEQGGKLYRTHCASCHGEQGRGDGPAGAGLTPRPADLTHLSEHHRDGDTAWKIATGKGAMPGWKSTLTEAQIWHLVNYLKSIGSHGGQGSRGHHGGDEGRERHR
ncbi:MAG: cytochrome c [Nitrospirota bacterium]